MKTTRNLLVLSLAACMALLVGCSTPDSRIKDSPAAFERLTPDQQALVKAGQIAPGFDMDAVRLALGDPDRTLIITNASGQHQVWRYVTYEDYQGVLIYGGYYHRTRGWGRPYFWAGAPYYDGYPARIHERLRVIFDTNARVSSIEQDQP
jgi:outer membrane protein assembly factor BamE (lipoprotein component of BamABCDE complex)